MARRLLGTAVTDENGEATIEYTGTGAGELHIVAESGTFSSNVITIDDYDPIIDSATITSDKNIIQSGESANLTVIGKDKHNELVNEDTFDLCEQFIVSKVSVDSTGIVQSGSNLDIKAKVNTSLGGVPNNVPVVFKKGDETLDTVQTSASGVATYPYPGTGVGEVNITAECDGVVSETCEVLDCKFFDDMHTGTASSKWWVWQAYPNTVSRADGGNDYTKLTTDGTDGYYFLDFYTGLTGVTKLQFDVYISGGATNKIFVTLRGDKLSFLCQHSLSNFPNASLNTWLTFEYDLEAKTLTCLTTNETYSYTGTVVPKQLGMQCHSGVEMRVRNVKAY